MSHLYKVDENLPEFIKLFSEEVSLPVAACTLALPGTDREEVFTVIRKPHLFQLVEYSTFLKSETLLVSVHRTFTKIFGLLNNLKI